MKCFLFQDSFLLLASLFLLVDSRKRIINGRGVVQGRFPYTVQLWDNGPTKELYCGGTLIAKNLVLTAAHCKFAAPEMMKVAINPYFGPGTRAATGSETFNVIKIRIHPRFGDRAPFANDVMILKLDGTSKFRPITLNRNRTFPVNATRLTVLGWGTQERGQDKPPPYLLQDSAISVTNSYCQKKYKTLRVTGEMLCVRDDGSCQGDSGGPLIMKGSNSRQDVQVGVVSWGIGCNSDIYPGVYQRVSHQWQWIRSNACRMTTYNAAFDCRTSSPTRAPTRAPTRRKTLLPSSIPSLSPSRSSAPSMPKTFILIRIQTDYFPKEISWILKDGNRDIIFQRPAGYFTDVKIYDEIVVVNERDKLVLEIHDNGNDGMISVQEGFIAVYSGKVADAARVYAFHDGKFNSSVILDFIANDDYTFYSKVPTTSPSINLQPSASPAQSLCPAIPPNGCSICGKDRCVLSPEAPISVQNYTTCGELENAGHNGLLNMTGCVSLSSIIPTICLCSSPTSGPSISQPTASESPSTEPTITRLPSNKSTGEFLVVFNTDGFPHQSAWSIQDDIGDTVAQIKFGDLVVPNTSNSTLIKLKLGNVYSMIIYDSYGDGTCCDHGHGGIEIYSGINISNETRILNMSGNFTGNAKFIHFLAQDLVASSGAGVISSSRSPSFSPSFY